MTSLNYLIFFLFHKLWRGLKATSTPERTHAVVVNVLEYECAFERRTYYKHNSNSTRYLNTFIQVNERNMYGRCRRTCPFQSHALERAYAIVAHVHDYECAFERRTYYEHDSNSTRYFKHGFNKVMSVRS